MTEDFLKMIREEAQKEIAGLKEYNEYARLRNQLAKQEEIKKELGLPYQKELWMPEKTENEIIMSIYRKHLGEIEEQDTNEIYYYDGTYKYVYDCWLESYGLGPMDKLVDRDDLEANYRRYSNIEGVYSYTFDLKEAEKFEKTHTVIYTEEADKEDSSLYRIIDDFVITSVKESQEKAISLVLKKYNTKRK